MVTLKHNLYVVMVWQNLHLWLGGMFIPEAYITATRQYVAQANSWSLEELGLQVNSNTCLPVIVFDSQLPKLMIIT